MLFPLNYLNFFDFQETANKNRIESNFITNFLTSIGDRIIGDAHPIATALYHTMTNTSLHYHTPVHILSMFQYAKELLQWELLFHEELAMWFHDAIYIPGNPTNEEQSADFMTALLKGRVNDVQLQVAHRIIMDTANHHEKFDHVVNNRVLDLDLWTLSAEKEVFQKVNDLIRLEFSKAEDEPYKIARRQFMINMTEKGFIYRTKEFENKEKAAWENLSDVLC